MSERPYLRPKYRGSGRMWWLYALLWGGIPLFCCLGLWHAACLNATKDPPEPDVIARFRQNREDFDKFVPFYHSLGQGERFAFPSSFDMGTKEEARYPVVLLEGDCLLLRWRFGSPFNRDYILIRSPRGMDGLPKKHREENGTGDTRITPIEGLWFHVSTPFS